MSSIKCGNIVEGQVTGITKYGIFVSLEDNYVGMIHISEVCNGFVEDLKKMYAIGDILKVKVLDIDDNKMQVKLSIKKILNKGKMNNSRLVEKGKGFTPLSENMSIWINDKMEEIKEKM